MLAIELAFRQQLSMGSFTTGYWCAAVMNKCGKERQAWCQRNHGWLEHQPGEGFLFFRTMFSVKPCSFMFILLAIGWNTELVVKPEVWPTRSRKCIDSHRWSSTLPYRLKSLFSSSMSTRTISRLCLASRNTLPNSILWSSLDFYFSTSHFIYIYLYNSF